MRRWLTNHTWIDWYLRDGHGTPRRLLDESYAGKDKSTDERWKGYGPLAPREALSENPSPSISASDREYKTRNRLQTLILRTTQHIFYIF